MGKEINGSVLEWPLVNLCLVSCDVSGLPLCEINSVEDWEEANTELTSHTARCQLARSLQS